MSNASINEELNVNVYPKCNFISQFIQQRQLAFTWDIRMPHEVRMLRWRHLLAKYCNRSQLKKNSA